MGVFEIVSASSLEKLKSIVYISQFSHLQTKTNSVEIENYGPNGLVAIGLLFILLIFVVRNKAL